MSAYIRRALGLGARPSSLAGIGTLDLVGQVGDHEERLARREELVIELGLTS